MLEKPQGDFENDWNLKLGQMKKIRNDFKKKFLFKKRKFQTCLNRFQEANPELYIL